MMNYLFDPTDPTQVYYNPLPDNATKEELEQYQRLTLKMLIHGIVMFLSVLLLMALVSLFTSCATPQPVIVERTTHDTVQVTRLQRDSIFLRDSIHVREHTVGDTVYLEVNRWHTQYRDRWHHDSILIARCDSIPVPYPVEKRVPAQLNTWQQLRIWLGNIVLVALAVLAAWWLIHKKTWWLRLL
jgi:hypothetical protein